MGKLDHLKIKKAPACFAGWAKQFNQQVDLLGSIQGGPGIDIQIAHSPRKTISGPPGHKPKEQPRGKILLTLRPSAINGIGVGGITNGNGNSNSNINSVNTNAVYTDGSIVSLTVQAAALNPNSFPTVLRTNGGGTTNYGITNATGWELRGTTNSVSIPFSAIVRPMSIRTLQICDNGNTRSIDVIASDTY